MERLAWNQGIQSWTQLSRREPEFALAVLYGRFEKYFRFSKHGDVGRFRLACSEPRKSFPHADAPGPALY
jgi:hypothetical protein